jgi:WhiB family redox-sensing transcriptional regulator
MADWRDRANCIDSPELHFPVGDGEMAAHQTIEAVKVCIGCSVRAQCLTWALDNHPVEGVWGGSTLKERKARRKRARLGRRPDPHVEYRRQQVAWMHNRGLRAFQIAERLGITPATVSADLARVKDAA